jgi:Ca-activated chloride channel family protein
LLETPTKTKIIILLTDGVSQVDTITPAEAAELARDSKVKIYSVAVGTDQDALIPVGDLRFYKRYQAIPGGSYDEETLNEMAIQTGGKFFKVKDEDSLERILNEINKLEETKIDRPKNDEYLEEFYRFLFPGVLLLILTEFIRRFLLKEAL